MLKSKKSLLNNEDGTAMIEVLPVIFVIITFLTFSLGFFGAIHSGILNSIAARNYAFETFRHRSNLVYFRSNGDVSTAQLAYNEMGLRIHGVNSEDSPKSGDPKWYSSTRPINIMILASQKEVDQSGSKSEHNQQVPFIKDEERNERVGVNPIWIKSQYGICLNAACGA
ncbi:hypothetical protein B9G69_007605 [Bdellovibrio sp. SKB1291214]|uniref:hypothetical protein n=1 Tax=Bdellovibrio sp. SKB1291214 TaxID=1732569 RepID=UPI000B516354|nr:hypothetical protein [Bdellovibrio sp. SKB1291214]UYL10444.1 hypothetical protein B9G69_007605 [Bdellovibrio sp. SKB1291214]